MNNISKLLVVVVGVAAGYIATPHFIPEGGLQLGSQEDSAQDDSSSGPAIQMDLSKVIAADFPEEINLKRNLTIKDTSSGVTIELKEGTAVKPIKLSGQSILIQPIGIPLKTQIPVDDTNFKALTLPNLLKRMANGGQVIQQGSPAEVAANAEVDAMGEPSAPVEPTPEPVAKTEPTPEPVVKTEPTPKPVAKTPRKTTLTDEEIIEVMKESIEAGEVTEFTLDQVIEWRKGGEEVVEGITYKQSGRLIFSAETILGEHKYGAIALIKRGKIVKWAWARNMLTMR